MIIKRSLNVLSMSVAQSKLIIRLKNQYIVANIKYRSDNLIILYYCIYYELSNIIGLSFKTLCD